MSNDNGRYVAVLVVLQYGGDDGGKSQDDIPNVIRVISESLTSECV